MATFTRLQLSGSTDGLPIKIAATATPGTLLHTAGASGMDELYLYVANTSAVAATITVEWGSATDPDGLLVKAYSIPANSIDTQIAFGQALSNSKAARAFAGTANVLTVTGRVIRIV